MQARSLVHTSRNKLILLGSIKSNACKKCSFLAILMKITEVIIEIILETIYRAGSMFTISWSCCFVVQIVRIYARVMNIAYLETHGFCASLTYKEITSWQ